MPEEQAKVETNQAIAYAAANHTEWFWDGVSDRAAGAWPAQVAKLVVSVDHDHEECATQQKTVRAIALGEPKILPELILHVLRQGVRRPELLWKLAEAADAHHSRT